MTDSAEGRFSGFVLTVCGEQAQHVATAAAIIAGRRQFIVVRILEVQPVPPRRGFADLL
jgi:hypothetical protein